jgi:arabinose-5-phosphate isomerase
VARSGHLRALTHNPAPEGGVLLHDEVIMTTAKHRAKDAKVAAGRAAAILALETESDALARLAACIDGVFDEAVETLFARNGRIVVTGIGKSGHVARKIAATLASTGTPAMFVHPSEASHGDLGMIGREDAVLALSNSGRTTELADIITYARRFRIPVIGMTSGANSPLADGADVLLLLPHAVEACPLQLAPTTSTTMMMALGDALAIALLTRRGFSADDFKVFHPGGTLGNRLIRVSDIMHKAPEVPLAAPHAAMADAILEMTRCGFGCVGVVGTAGTLVGIITDGDLRRHMSPDLLAKPVAAVMTAQPHTIRPGALAAEALGEMNLHKVNNLFVTQEDRPVGLIRVHDCLRAGVA